MFLTANLWDYASLIAMAIPNRFHPWIVAIKRKAGRKKMCFPTVYRCNSKAAITRVARAAQRDRGFSISVAVPELFHVQRRCVPRRGCHEKLITSTPLLAFLRGWVLVTLRKPDRSAAARLILRAAPTDKRHRLLRHRDVDARRALTISCRGAVSATKARTGCSTPSTETFRPPDIP